MVLLSIIKTEYMYTQRPSLVLRLFGLLLSPPPPPPFNAGCKFTPPLNLHHLTFCFNAVWVAVFCYANPLFLIGM